MIDDVRNIIALIKNFERSVENLVSDVNKMKQQHHDEIQRYGKLLEEATHLNQQLREENDRLKLKIETEIEFDKTNTDKE